MKTETKEKILKELECYDTLQDKHEKLGNEEEATYYFGRALSVKIIISILKDTGEWDSTHDYEAKAIAVRAQFAPQIYPYAHCGNPVANGYRCKYCGSDEPCTLDTANK